MAWIKRNLFFTLGGVVALLLLAGAGWYVWMGWAHNTAAYGRLNEIYGQLKQFSVQQPSPGNAKIDNVKVAKEQEAQVRAWVAETGSQFQAIPPIPAAADVTGELFAADLRRTLDQLQHSAEVAGVQLPPKYGFSFEAQRTILKFAPGSLNALALQLGEVKKITEILFAARVNSLDSVQRVRVSADDIAGPAGDYYVGAVVTNNLAVITPYVVTFRSFTPELAAVLAGFASSPNGFVVKAINVAPAASVTQDVGQVPPYYNNRMPGMPGAPGTPPPPARGGGGLPTVLKEQLLRITLEVVIVKPLPKK